MRCPAKEFLRQPTQLAARQAAAERAAYAISRYIKADNQAKDSKTTIPKGQPLVEVQDNRLEAIRRQKTHHLYRWNRHREIKMLEPGLCRINLTASNGFVSCVVRICILSSSV